MKSPLALTLALSAAVAGCAGSDVPINADFSPPVSTEIARGFALRDRYDVPKHVGHTPIFVDSVAVHHTYVEASTIVWRDEAGKWQWSRVSETGPGGLLPAECRLESNKSSPLTALYSETLDRLIRDPRLYSEKTRISEPMGIGSPSHVMSIVTPFGRRTISWGGQLEGIGGAVAGIVLGRS